MYSQIFLVNGTNTDADNFIMIGRTMICCANGIGEMAGSDCSDDDVPKLIKADGGEVPLLLLKIPSLLVLLSRL